MLRTSLLTAAFLSIAFLQAEPAWRHEVSPLPQSIASPLPPVSLDFTLTWNGGLDAGNIHMELGLPNAEKPAAYVVTASGSSVGPAAIIYPFTFNFWSELNPTSLRPKYFRASQIDKSETETTEVRYYPDRCEATTNIKKKSSQAETIETVKYEFAPIYDIFSTMLLIRNHKMNSGEALTLVIHPFDKPYLFQLKCVGPERHADKAAIKYSFTMQKIDRKTGELKKYKKLQKPAELWLSDDAERLPLEIRAQAAMGDIRAILTNHTL